VAACPNNVCSPAHLHGSSVSGDHRSVAEQLQKSKGNISSAEPDFACAAFASAALKRVAPCLLVVAGCRHARRGRYGKKSIAARAAEEDSIAASNGHEAEGSEAAKTRRRVVQSLATATVVGLAAERTASASTTMPYPPSLEWKAAATTPGGFPEEERIFRPMDKSPEWTVDFIIYLARFMLNYDDMSRMWWQNEVMPGINPNDPKAEQAADMRAKFASYAASVQYGLRRYVDQGRRASGILKTLVDRYGKDEEAKRQLALAFTLLEDQPLEIITSLLKDVQINDRLQAVFSPALSDYMAMDPQRLLPSTQYPIWDEATLRWIIPGLRNAKPYRSNLDDADLKLSVFGPRSDDLVFKERGLTPNDYALFAVSGAIGCAFTHSLVIPLDVVKTRLQTDPTRYKDLVDGAITINKEEGIAGLTSGWEPTILGYLWYGITVYPGYEFFKRLFFAFVGQAVADSFRVPLVLLAGATATVFACFGVCPAETCRIRMVSDGNFKGQGLAQVASTMAAQDGYGTFYDGLSTILVRQILFGMMKFLVFDYFADLVFDIFPVLTEKTETQLAVSLLSGAVAGVVSSVVSQPADTVLSKMNQGAGNKNFLDVGKAIYEEQGFGGFFVGLGSRCVWAGCIISGQFFLYDVCKTLLGVKDLRMFLDVRI